MGEVSATIHSLSFSSSHQITIISFLCFFPNQEEKKPEESKGEEKKAEEPKEDKKPEQDQKAEESKDEKESKEEESAPPPEIVLRVFMHCEGCARKVRRSLKGFPGKNHRFFFVCVSLFFFFLFSYLVSDCSRTFSEFSGVEDILTDCKSHKVVVKGEKADPLKVLERVQRKSHRKVELLSPIPKPPAEEEKKAEEEKPKAEEEKKKEVINQFIIFILL